MRENLTEFGEIFEWIWKNFWVNQGKISLSWGKHLTFSQKEAFDWIQSRGSIDWISLTWIEGNLWLIWWNIWLHSGKYLTELKEIFDWIGGNIWLNFPDLNWGKHFSELGKIFDWNGENIWLNFHDLNWGNI